LSFNLKARRPCFRLISPYLPSSELPPPDTSLDRRCLM